MSDTWDLLDPGREATDPMPGAWDLIAGHERLRAADVPRRKQEGAFYTPPALAAQVAAMGLAPFLAGAAGKGPSPSRLGGTADPLPRILDPAVGGGTFLLAAIDTLAAAGLDPRLAARCCTGYDRDPGAIEVARDAVHLHCGGDPRLEVSDALLAEPRPDFDVVLGNPPWEKISRLDPRRPYFDRRFAEIREGEINLHALFLVWSLRCLKPGGVLAMITPNTWLLNRWDALLRRHLLGFRLEEVAILPAGTFPDTPITVPAVVVIRNAEPRGKVRVRAPGFASEADPEIWRNRPHAGMSVFDDTALSAIDAQLNPHSTPLGDLARASDGIYTSTARAFAFYPLPFTFDPARFPPTSNPTENASRVGLRADATEFPLAPAEISSRVGLRADTTEFQLAPAENSSRVGLRADPIPDSRPILLSGAEAALDLILHGGAHIPRALWAKHEAAQHHDRLVLHAARHPSLERRLVGAVVPAGVYTSNRFINVVSAVEDPYFLAAVLLSRTLDRYFARRFPIADVDAFMLHQLPIPAAAPAAAKARLAALARERSSLRRRLTTLLTASRLATAQAAPSFAGPAWAATSLARAIARVDDAVEDGVRGLLGLTPAGGRSEATFSPLRRPGDWK